VAKRWAGALLVLSALAAPLFPAAPTGATPSDEVPTCGPEVTSPLAGCLQSTTPPEGVPGPITTVPAPVNLPSGLVQQTVMFTDVANGPACERDGVTGIHFAPCTDLNTTGAGLYVPGQAEVGDVRDIGITSFYHLDAPNQNRFTFTWNPASFTGVRYVIVVDATTIFTCAGIYTSGCNQRYQYSFAVALQGSEENRAPVADFSYEQVSPTDFGLWRFTSQATDPDGDAITSQTWDFGDGGINVGPQVIHVFAKPGDYSVAHRVVDSHGLATTSSQVVHVPAPSLRVAVSLPDAIDNQLAPGVPTRAHVTVTAGDDGLGALSSVAFVGDPLQASPAGALSVDTPLVPSPAGLSLAPGESREFDAVVHGDRTGAFTLSSTVRAVDAAGRDVVPVTATVDGTVSGLAVHLASSGTGQDTIDVVVSVTNQGTTPIDGLQYAGGGIAVHPEYVPDALRGVVALVGGPSDTLPSHLDPGETRQATYTFHAEGPGDVAVVAEATAPAGGGTISANDAGYIGIQKRVLDPAQLKNVLVDLVEGQLVDLQSSARTRQQLLTQAMNARVIAARAKGALVDLPSQLIAKGAGPIVPYPEFDNLTLTEVAIWGQAKGLAQGVGKVLDFTIGTPAEYYASMITSGSFSEMAQDYVDAGLAAQQGVDAAAYGTFTHLFDLYDRYVDVPDGAYNQQQYSDITEALTDEYKGQMLEYAANAPRLQQQQADFDKWLDQQEDAILRDPYGWADKVTTAAGELEGETLAGEAAALGGTKLVEQAATAYEYSRYGKSGAAIKRVTEGETLESLGAGSTTSANIERLGGITETDQQKIHQIAQEVKDKFGVDVEIQARPSNPYSVQYLNSELGAIGKPEIFKAKNLSDIDVILGADPKGLGKLGVFEPKLPPDRVMAKLPPEVANEVKLRFKTQQGVWNDWNDPTSKFAKNFTKASKPGGGTFDFEVPTAAGDAAPSAPRQYHIEVDVTKPGRNNTISFFEKTTGKPIVSDIDFHGYFKVGGRPLDAGTRGQIELYLQNRWKESGISFGDHGATLNGFDWAGSGTQGGAVARHKFGLEFMEPAAARARAEELSAQLGVPVEKLLEGYTPGKFVVTFRHGDVSVGYGKTF
jgi:PKD repeat protein